MFDPIGFIKNPIVFIRYFQAKRNLKKSRGDEVTEDFLTLLLDLMKWTFLIDPDYRRNIEHFTGAYRFKDRDGKVNVLVKFHGGKMEVSDDPFAETKVMVTFKDSKTLRDFLLAVKKDILQVLVRNQILVTGNLNYLYKFAFMANHPLRGLLNLENELT
ncbi:MAG: hypothetical protein ACLQUW_14625 [Desulfobaccales bacterium]